MAPDSLLDDGLELTEKPKHLWFYYVVVVIHTLPILFSVYLFSFFIYKGFLLEFRTNQIILAWLIIGSGIASLLFCFQCLHKKKKWVFAFQILNTLPYVFLFSFFWIETYQPGNNFNYSLLILLIPVLTFPLLTWLSIRVSKSWKFFK